MNLEEALRIVKTPASYAEEDYSEASCFLEGYEVGVRESAELQMKSHRLGDQLALMNKCEHIDRRDNILKLLEKVK